MDKKPISLLSGITGQDGSYLAELLLSKGHIVHGIIRRSSSFNTGRIDHKYQDPHNKDINLFLHYGDLIDSLSIDNIVQKVKPDFIWHLGAQSHVHVSFEVPKYTGEVDALGTLHILEAMRKHVPHARFYNAATSELFGKVQEIPQNENTPFYPRSPYGVAKIYSYWITKNYREAYNLFASNGILFNHESPRRGGTFVTKKVISKLTEIAECGPHLDPLYIGYLEAKRDWGFAPEFVDGMWRILQHNEPDDFVLATGETHSVRELVEETCKCLNLNIEWKGEGLEEVGICKNKGFNDRIIIKIDPKYYRPTEVNLLVGDAYKAKKILGWEPKTKFKDLIKIMVESELKL
jgi:GDPmannose 4,6-dehydratase